MTSGETVARDGFDGAVIWDVIEEHFDCLDYCVAAFQRAHTHPLMTLSEMARGIEARLLAHLDGLAVAGSEVASELQARFAEPLPPEFPSRVTAVVLGLVANGIEDDAARLLAHGDRRVRLAVARGLRLAAHSRLERAAAASLAQAKTAEEKGAWLELMGHRDLEPAAAARLLTSADMEVVAGALRCLRGRVPSLDAAVERLAGHAEPLVRERALRVALAWGTPYAWELCERQALDVDGLSPWAIVAYAILGGPAQRARLVQSVGSKVRTPHVLRALGFSGSVDVVPALLERLSAKSAFEAKIAAQAIAAIAGLDLRKDEFAADQAPGRADSLPPLEEDDLDADLVPPPEDALEHPNADSIRAWWGSQQAKLKSPQRFVLGAPRTPESLFEALEHGPLGLRSGWAMALHLWSGGLFLLDSEAFTEVQRTRISQARAALGQWPKRKLGVG